MKQTEIPGTERPDKNPDIEAALDAWFDAQDAQRQASHDSKAKHAALLLQIEAAGLESYPFLDRKGKKKRVFIQKTPKAKVARDLYRLRDSDAEVGEEVELRVVDEDTGELEPTPATDDKVEMRRVSRKSVEKELDPFAATRGAMDDDGNVDVLEQANAELAPANVMPKAKRKKAKS